MVILAKFYRVASAWKIDKHNKITLTRIRLPAAKLPCHEYSLWLVSYSICLAEICKAIFLLKQLNEIGPWCVWLFVWQKLYNVKSCIPYYFDTIKIQRVLYSSWMNFCLSMIGQEYFGPGMPILSNQLMRTPSFVYNMVLDFDGSKKSLLRKQ